MREKVRRKRAVYPLDAYLGKRPEDVEIFFIAITDRALNITLSSTMLLTLILSLLPHRI